MCIPIMKLPNGYGSVYKLHGNRRKPYAVRITVSCQKDQKGKKHWKYQYLGYYRTQREGLNALAQFHVSYQDVMNQNLQTDPGICPITFEKVFSAWSAEHFPKVSASNIRGYQASYALCSPLYSMPFILIRKQHLQQVVDTCEKNYPSLKKLKILFALLYKYALENDICDKDYSQYVDIHQYRHQNPNALKRQPFNRKERLLLWKQASYDEYASIVLMLIYSGCRISELLELKKEHVNLKKGWFDITNSKTDAGVRKVPIAKKVLPFFKCWMEKNSCIYLLSTPEGKHLTYPNYYTCYWKPLMKKLNMSGHRPHDTRHTFITLLTTVGTDDKIIKKIVGHKGSSVTESVYTHFDIVQLAKAIDRID